MKVAEIELGRLTDAQKKAPDLVLPQALDKARGAADVAHANMERTRTLLAFSKITAPFPGIITMRFVDNGAFVPAATSGGAQNAAIFTVMDYTAVRAQLAVPELETPFIRAGLPVKITFEALPGKTFEATTRAIPARSMKPRARCSPRPTCPMPTARCALGCMQTASALPATVVVSREHTRGLTPFRAHLKDVPSCRETSFILT